MDSGCLDDVVTGGMEPSFEVNVLCCFFCSSSTFKGNRVHMWICARKSLDLEIGGKKREREREDYTVAIDTGKRPGEWGNLPFYVRCLRKQMTTMMWEDVNANQWDECAARATLLMARALVDLVKNEYIYKPEYLDGEELHEWTVKEHGGIYVAILVAEHLERCMVRNGCGAQTWEALDDLMKMAPKLRDLYDAFRRYGSIPTAAELKHRVWKDMTDFRGEGCDVLTVGPYGFNNEPVFSPSLHMPSKALRVCTLVLKEYSFVSSFVDWVIFPFELQTDVELASLFLRDTLRELKPKWIFAADSGGVLLIAKLASRLEFLKRRGRLPLLDVEPLRALEQSGPVWPPLYPPTHLSKLMPGHEHFAPPQVVVSDDDGLRQIDLDVNLILDQLLRWNCTGYLKKEYSEATRGVARASPQQSAVRKAVTTVLPRGVGSSQLDMDIRVRIFLQREVQSPLGVSAVGLRFYALNGTLVAGHSSNVVHGTLAFGVSYVTTRHAVVERETALLVRFLNYSGFATAWWWIDGRDGFPYLIDFNPRLERQACLSPALPARMRHMDACSVFQDYATGRRSFDPNVAPIFVPAGFRYVEPNRAMDANTKSMLQLLRDPQYAWNWWPEDRKALEFVKWRTDQVDGAIASFEAQEAKAKKEEQAKVTEHSVTSLQMEEKPLLEEIRVALKVCNPQNWATCRGKMRQVIAMRDQEVRGRYFDSQRKASPGTATPRSRSLLLRKEADQRDASSRWNDAKLFWDNME